VYGGDNVTVTPGMVTVVVVTTTEQVPDWRLAKTLPGISLNVGCGCSPVVIRLDAVADGKGNS
jgi:hypothetical protein